MIIGRGVDESRFDDQSDESKWQVDSSVVKSGKHDVFTIISRFLYYSVVPNHPDSSLIDVVLRYGNVNRGNSAGKRGTTRCLSAARKRIEGESDICADVISRDKHVTRVAGEVSALGTRLFGTCKRRSKVFEFIKPTDAFENEITIDKMIKNPLNNINGRYTRTIFPTLSQTIVWQCPRGGGKDTFFSVRRRYFRSRNRRNLASIVNIEEQRFFCSAGKRGRIPFDVNKRVMNPSFRR